MTAKVLKHKFNSAVADGTDATLIRPSNWNDEHNLYRGYRTVTGTTDPVADTDNFALVRYNNAAGVTASVPAPTGGNMAAGWSVRLKNVATSGVVTINGTGGATFNGMASLTLYPQEAVDIESQGTADYDAKLHLSASSPNFSLGTYSQRGLTGVNNASNPTTQFDFAANDVTLRNSAGQMSRVNNPSATNNTSTAGPAANGRDQAGAFAASSWIHFYWIYNAGTATMATISSANAPPTGPSLPSGYTYWCYIGAVLFNASSQLRNVVLRGSKFFHRTQADCQVLSLGTSGGPANVSLAVVLPPNGLTAQLNCIVYNGGAAIADVFAALYVVGSNEYYRIRNVVDGNHFMQEQETIEIPNVGQNIAYGVVGTQLSLFVQAYTVPNGSE